MATFLVAAALVACKTSTAPNSNRSVLPDNSAQAHAAGSEDVEIGAARSLFLTKCARCHKFYDPAAYNDVEWHAWMTKMARKTRLKPAQQQLLTRYLETFRTPAPTTHPIPP